MTFNIAKWKKQIWKACMLYVSNYMTFWKRQNFRDSKQISSSKGLERWERINRTQQTKQVIKEGYALTYDESMVWVKNGE